MILSDNYCKPYLDIEWKLAKNKTISNKKLNKFIKN